MKSAVCAEAFVFPKEKNLTARNAITKRIILHWRSLLVPFIV